MEHSNHFIRFKDIPENELSGVHDGDLGVVRHEDGVSCYEFIKEGDNHKIVLPSFDSGVCYDLINFIEDFKSGEIPAYIIQAEKTGIGTYGEPIVKNITIVSKLKLVELANPKPHFKLDKTNQQLQSNTALS